MQLKSCWQSIYFNRLNILNQLKSCNNISLYSFVPIIRWDSCISTYEIFCCSAFSTFISVLLQWSAGRPRLRNGHFSVGLVGLRILVFDNASLTVVASQVCDCRIYTQFFASNTKAVYSECWMLCFDPFILVDWSIFWLDVVRGD